MGWVRVLWRLDFVLWIELEHVLLCDVPGGIADQGSGWLVGAIVGVMVAIPCSAN